MLLLGGSTQKCQNYDCIYLSQKRREEIDFPAWTLSSFFLTRMISRTMPAGETPVHSMTKRESEVSFLFSYKRVFC